MEVRVSCAVCLLVFLTSPLPAMAEDTAIVNGTEYHCQNVCVVTTTSSGRTMVSDSRGGWIHRHSVNRRQ